MTRFDFSPSFRRMLDFALHMGLVDGVEVAAMTAGAVAAHAHRPNLVHNIELAIGLEIDEAADARMHDRPEIRRIWFDVRARCKAIAFEGERTGGAGIDTFRRDESLCRLWRDAQIECW